MIISDQIIGQAKILIIDDEQPNVRLLERLLLTGGFSEVFGTTDPRNALSMFDQVQPDLVMLDLNIPPPSGAAVLEEMRRAPGLDDIPVVIVTSSQLDSAQLALLASSAVVLDKARFSADLLPHAAGDAARLVERSA